MPTLFTYRITHDAGFAPNPFGGICTLATCKPRIRLAAAPGDWVAAIGAKNQEIREHHNQLIYAMRVSRKITLQEYDALTRECLEIKVADRTSADAEKRVGDSIFDFRCCPPEPRPSQHSHSAKTRDKDLRGTYALLSDRFFYFGDHSVTVPPRLLALFPQAQGHRSGLNAPFVQDFINWIDQLGYEPNILHGKPIQLIFPTLQDNPLVIPSESTPARRCR